MRRPEVSSARKQRRKMSYPEALLWQRLRSRVSGLHFRHQHPIGPYIVDFYYAPKRMAVEVDGQIHATAASIAHDSERDRFLASNRYDVVHINAADVLKDADATAASIVSLAASPLHRPADGPPPRAGEDQE
ncbi:endonuclease domain-containing protein [Sphingomonas sp. MMS12-HWE2-04]|uniref:endonuclease domain-containing protein n=1 Tax=Sphingomonas sp. MMS12-HWE2-04 TaxID=3234199 RepID=UPI00384AFD73